jgi:ADP-ribosylglycohydrolase
MGRSRLGKKMLGAIAGDVIGSIYEARPIKSRDFPLFGPGCRFTDDTVCTVAVADALLDGSEDFATYLRRWGRRYPNAGYGGMFLRWLADDRMGAYGSYGNGAPMRVAPVGWLASDEAEVLRLAAASAAISHDHPDAVAGAKAVALAIWRARAGSSPAEIRREIVDRFGYDLERSVDDVRPDYGFDISAAGTVPPALTAAVEAENLEGAIRGAVSLGGDADTLACIAGGIAEALYGLTPDITKATRARLDAPLLAVVDRFYARPEEEAAEGSGS